MAIPCNIIRITFSLLSSQFFNLVLNGLELLSVSYSEIKRAFRQWAGVALSVSYSEIKSITYYLIPAIPPERRNTRKAEHMSYLYFKPRTYVPTRNNQWVDPKFQQIITLLESCSSKSQLVQILAQLIRTELICDSFLASQFISLICSSSEPLMVYVRKVFDQIP